MNILLVNLAKLVNASGGLAKVNIAFANAMNDRGHNVNIVYMDGNEGSFFYNLNKGINYYDLQNFTDTKTKQTRKIKFPLYLKAVREFIRPYNIKKARSINNYFIKNFLYDNLLKVIKETKPDIIVAFQPAASDIIINKIKLDIPIIMMSHGDPEDYFMTYPDTEVEVLGKNTVHQVLTPNALNILKKYLPSNKIIEIGNVIPQFKEIADLNTEKNTYKIICVAKLTKGHKQPHLLIEAFNRISQDFPQWHLEFWGSKDRQQYYNELLSLIKKNNLTNKVFLKGTTKNIPEKLRYADIFVLPSSVEGFGMALAEGLSIGLPGIAYKSCRGLNELIIDGFNGFLCDDGIGPLSEKLKILMSDKNLRVKMGYHAHESMRKYSANNIWNKWEDLMTETLQEYNKNLVKQ